MYKIIATKDKGYVCVGFTKGYGAINSDVYFLKCDSNIVGSVNIVSVNEYSYDNVNINIFPNPTDKFINIVTSKPIPLKEIKLLDISGKEILLNEGAFYSSNKHFILKVEHLVSGIYFISIANKIEKISVVH
jgi:hypothetical protein